MNRFWTFRWMLGAALIAVFGCGGSSSEVGPIEGFVCGTDGNTYSVEEAAREEHEVAHRGRCDEPMQCDSEMECFVGDECVGWCVPGPTSCNCPGVFEPVCGGDGRNYINACEASCAGAGVRHEGYCQEPPGEGCVRTGCSGQLCVEEGMDVASTCEWRPVYECYQQATCERQQNGQCGFTPTHQLVECLESFGEGMCRIDPRWQDGFEAECESPQVPGIVGVIGVAPHGMMQLGEPFEATFTLLEPAIFDASYAGEGLLFCDGESTLLRGFAAMTPFGDLEFTCSILPDEQPGECVDDADCPPGHYCERFTSVPDDAADPSIPAPVPGVCVDLCALIDCLPGYVCEAGQCIPVGDCPVETHIVNFDGECVPKCYGPEQCGDEQRCNASEVCRPDPACPECDVCVGWCVPPSGDCRTNGCEEGWTCDYCQTPDGGAEWICLSPEAGACLPPQECRPTGCNGEICANQDVASPCVALPEFACYQQLGRCELQPWGQCGWTPTPELDACLSEFDCRAMGCSEGDYCTYCWFSWECIPEGAVC
ncbi:MAG TPA: hypothetical protein VLS88_06430 [Polyangiales bacterium]|nr:hypothetical protein [Polyangiales bacterium]